MAEPFPGRLGGTNPLSRNPIKTTYKPIKDDIGSPSEGMYDSSRPRYMRKRKVFTVPYQYLTTADKVAILTHYDTVNTTGSFDWIDEEGDTYSVTYVEPPEWEKVADGYYSFSPFQFKEV